MFSLWVCAHWTWLVGWGCSEVQGLSPAWLLSQTSRVLCAKSRSEQRHSGLRGVVEEGISSAGNRQREKTKAVPGFPQQEVLWRKVKVLLSPGSEFPPCLCWESAGAMTDFGNNPARQTALKCSGADKTHRENFGVWPRSPHTFGAEWNPKLQDVGPAMGTHRCSVHVGKVRTDPKRAFFYCNGSNQTLMKACKSSCLCHGKRAALLLQQSSFVRLTLWITLTEIGCG